jgi:hypothetical protein
MTKTIFTAAFLLTLPTLAMAEPPQHDSPSPQMRELIKKIQQRYPAKWAHLQELKEENPRRFHAQLMKIRRHMMMGEQDPQISERMKANADLRTRFRETVDAYEDATGRAKEKLHEKLLELASEMFDARQAIRARRLAKAKERIADLEDEIDEREETRTELIETFVDDATGDTLQGL